MNRKLTEPERVLRADELAKLAESRDIEAAIRAHLGAQEFERRARAEVYFRSLDERPLSHEELTLGGPLSEEERRVLAQMNREERGE